MEQEIITFLCIMSAVCVCVCVCGAEERSLSVARDLIKRLHLR